MQVSESQENSVQQTSVNELFDINDPNVTELLPGEWWHLTDVLADSEVLLRDIHGNTIHMWGLGQLSNGRMETSALADLVGNQYAAEGEYRLRIQLTVGHTAVLRAGFVAPCRLEDGTQRQVRLKDLVRGTKRLFS